MYAALTNKAYACNCPLQVFLYLVGHEKKLRVLMTFKDPDVCVGMGSSVCVRVCVRVCVWRTSFCLSVRACERMACVWVCECLRVRVSSCLSLRTS